MKSRGEINIGTLEKIQYAFSFVLLHLLNDFYCNDTSQILCFILGIFEDGNRFNFDD